MIPHPKRSAVLLVAAAAATLVAPSPAFAQGQGTGAGGGAGVSEVPGVRPGHLGPGDTVPGRSAEAAGGSGAREAPAGSGGAGGTLGRPTVATPTIDVETLITLLEQDENDWRIWWKLNRDPLLLVDPSVAMPLSDDGGFVVGGRATRERSRIVAARQLTENVVPELLRALGVETSPVARAAIVLALGRAGSLVPEEGKLGVLELLKDPDRGVTEAAVVCAGLQASPAVLAQLAHVLHDCADGRQVLGGRNVDTRLQAFAALAMGLGVHRSDNEDLRRFVLLELGRAAGGEASSADLPAACVAAVGLLPLPWHGALTPDGAQAAPHRWREGQLAWLLGAARSDDVYREVRGHAALALGRLSEGAQPAWREHVGAALLELLSARSQAPEEVRQGAAAALGLLGDCDADPIDRRIRTALVRASREGGVLTRRFAVVALGRVASRDGDGEGSPERTRKEVRSHLLGMLERGRGGLDAWAALSLGILEREMFRRGVAPSSQVQAALEWKLERSRSPVNTGAFGLGLALSMAPESTDGLVRALERHGGDESAGAALALSLGLTSGRGARERLVDLIETSHGRPALLHDAALALALSGEFGGTPRLARAFQATTALDSRAALASALGRTGDTRAIDPLIEALTDRTAPQTSRALAARALGWLVDQGGPPVWSPLACDLNWGADTASLAGVAGDDFLALLRDF